MEIAIVGASLLKWKTEEQKKRGKFQIRLIFRHYATRMPIDYSNLVLVSGHCHEGGVDIWAEEIAKELGIQTEIYPAEVHQWEDKVVNQYDDAQKGKEQVIGFAVKRLKGYRSRNIQIAKACDVLYDIEPEGSCKHCGGKGKITFHFRIPRTPVTTKRTGICKSCKGIGVYSGGTWTMRKAKELGKEVHQLVVR